MRRLWYSDPHFSHFNMTRAGKDLCNRPYEDPQHMNMELLRNFNERVGDDDVVWFLGDGCMGRITDSLPLLGALNGTIEFQPGNHDRIHPYDKKAMRKKEYWYAEYGQYVRIMPLQRRTTLGPYRVLTCHFPMSPDEHYEVVNGVDKFARWRPVDDGSWDLLIHGHVHADWKLHENGRELNVGCDVWDYAPVSDEELLTFYEENK